MEGKATQSDAQSDNSSALTLVKDVLVQSVANSVTDGHESGFEPAHFYAFIPRQEGAPASGTTESKRDMLTELRQILRQYGKI